jgi:hypothetical protein
MHFSLIALGLLVAVVGLLYLANKLSKYEPED